MKIYGIFRGFPGLGRVVSGVSILSSLKKSGHVVKAYSYLQGTKLIEKNDFNMIIPDNAEGGEISSIGLNPIGKIGENLIETICRDKPDLVIIDGEPLLVSTLAMVYPREKILTLLNPADLYSPSQAKSSAEFLCMHYLSAGTAVVHGVNQDEIVVPDNQRGCNVITTNTILRQEVLDVNVGSPSRIVAILGGGCNNASDSFFKSTLEMGKRIVDAASLMPAEHFTIYCNDNHLSEELSCKSTPENISIIEEYASPNEMYKNAKAVICRAGRNTISEILYLDIPAILMSTNGDYRSVEQEKNMDQVCSLKPGRLIKASSGDSGNTLVDKIKSVISAKNNGYVFRVGNEKVLALIENVI